MYLADANDKPNTVLRSLCRGSGCSQGLVGHSDSGGSQAQLSKYTTLGVRILTNINPTQGTSDITHPTSYSLQDAMSLLFNAPLLCLVSPFKRTSVAPGSSLETSRMEITAS